MMVLLAQGVAVAVRVIEGDTQDVIGPLLDAVTVGVQMLDTTAVEDVVVQPFDWVTVRV